MKLYLVEVLPDDSLKKKVNVSVFDCAVFFELEEAMEAIRVYDNSFKEYPEMKIKYEIHEIKAGAWWRKYALRTCGIVRGARTSWKTYKRQTIAQIAEKFKKFYSEGEDI